MKGLWLGQYGKPPNSMLSQHYEECPRLKCHGHVRLGTSSASWTYFIGVLSPLGKDTPCYMFCFSSSACRSSSWPQ